MGVVTGAGGNVTKPEVELKLVFMMFSRIELTRKLLITAWCLSLSVNPDSGVPPSKNTAVVFF